MSTKAPMALTYAWFSELIGETLRSFCAWFAESMIPMLVMRKFTIQLLLALDYAHQENIIHTGTKPIFLFGIYP